jgi:hypothetical protein
MMVQPKSKGDESLLGTPELAGVLSLNRSPRGDALPEISKVAMLFREDDGTGKRRERRALPSIREDRIPNRVS